MSRARKSLWPLAVSLAAQILFLGSTGCGPSDPLEDIRQQQAAGEFEATLEPLRQLLAERVDDPEVQYLYGRALALSGQPSLGEWSLREAAKHPDWLVPAGSQLAFGALASNNVATAIEITNQILEVQPDNLEILLMRANAYAHSRQNDELALADAARVVELDPDNAEAMKPRILALIGLDRIDEAGAAIEDLSRRIEETDLGTEVEGWHCATAALFAQESGEAELAAKRWADCIEKYPAHPNVVGHSIGYYDEMRDFDRSLEILQRAAAEEPGSREYRTRLALRLRTRGESEEAEELLKKATEVSRPYLAVTAWVDLAKHYEDLGDYAAAADASQHAIALARKMGTPHPNLLLEHADALLLAGELDRALEIAAEMSVPEHQEMIRARVAQERDQHAEALKHFDEAFRLWPNNPWARYNAAVSAEALGDFDRAIAEYRYCLRIDIGGTDARTRLARLHLAQGKPAEALAMLRLQAEKLPIDLEGELLSLRLWARLGDAASLRSSLLKFAAWAAGPMSQALSHAAEGSNGRAGPAAAVGLLRQWESQGVDFKDPRGAAALYALVRFSHEAGVLDEAQATLRDALGQHPDTAALHVIHGRALELAGAPSEEIRQAYRRAAELEPENAGALAGLGRLSMAQDPESALSLFDRAAAADPGDEQSKLGAARALMAAGRYPEAEDRLKAVLEEHPYRPEAAAELAQLQLEHGSDSAQALALAERAVRFGGGAEALDLLSRIHQQRNDPERAEEAADRARKLRTQPEPGAGPESQAG